MYGKVGLLKIRLKLEENARNRFLYTTGSTSTCKKKSDQKSTLNKPPVEKMYSQNEPRIMLLAWVELK